MNTPVTPRTIRIHPDDNVAVVVNDGGLPAGTALPGGPMLVQAVPQGHKVALSDLPAGTCANCCSTWPRPRSRPFRTRKKCAGARPGYRALKATSRRSTWAGA